MRKLGGFADILRVGDGRVYLLFASMALRFRYTGSAPTNLPPHFPPTFGLIMSSARDCSLLLRFCVFALVFGGLIACGSENVGLVNSARGDDAVPNAGQVSDDGSALTQTINQAIQAQWQSLGITPAVRCSDQAFVRRVYLDLAGRIPTVEELQEFLADKSSDKRTKLVDTLLASEDHVQHLADTFDTLLMGRGDKRRYRERQDHHWRQWLEQTVRQNRPWNQTVADILIARPSKPEESGAVWYLYERENNAQAIAEAVAPGIFGVRIDCAQCHDHMIVDEIDQKHYWGLVAFFNRGKNEMTKQGPRVVESAIGGFSEFANLEGSSSPNLLTFLDAVTIDESRPDKDAKVEDREELYLASTIEGEPRVPKFSRREAFVREIAANHPLVARAMVNRLWAMLLGRGIVHPFDQMDSVHPASHPELLDELAADFRSHGYDIRRTLRAIALSDAYQLNSRRPDGVDDPSTFAWSLERLLTAEQLSRSLQLAMRGKVESPETRKELTMSMREAIPAVMPETIVTPISETLFLTNNTTLNRFIDDSNGDRHLIAQLRSIPNTEAAIERLMLTLLGRPATPEEQAMLMQFVTRGQADTGIQAVAPERWKAAVWALMTSAEFRFNH